MTPLLIDASTSLLTLRHTQILSTYSDFYPVVTIGFLEARFWGKFLWVDVYWHLLWNITQTGFDRYIFIDLELKKKPKKQTNHKNRKSNNLQLLLEIASLKSKIFRLCSSPEINFHKGQINTIKVRSIPSRAKNESWTKNAITISVP